MSKITILSRRACSALITLTTVTASFVPAGVLAAEKAPLPSAAKCLVELCGSYESANFDNLVRPKAHLERIKSDYDRRIAPIIEQEIKNDILAKQEGLRLIEYMAKADLTSATYSDEVKLVSNWIAIAGFLGKLVDGGAIVSSSGKGGYRLEREKARRIAIVEKLVDIEGSLVAIEAFIETNALLVLNNSDIKISTLHKANYSHLTYNGFISYILEYIDTWDKKLSDVNPYVVRQKSSLLKKYATDGTITDEDSELFFPALAGAFIVQQVYESPAFSTTLRLLKREIPVEAKSRLQELKALAPLLRQRLKAEELGKRTIEVRRLCESRYAQKLKSFPLPEEIRLFQTRYVPRVVDAATRVLTKQGLDRFSEKIRTLDWKPPLAYDSAVNSLVTHLQDELNEAEGLIRARSGFWEKLKAGDKAALGFAIVRILTMSKEEFNDALYSVNDDCKTLRPTPMGDSILTDEKIVNVGWQTVYRPETAALVMGHEIGHLVYRSEPVLDSKIQNKISCLNQRHVGLEENPARYSEEDYADLFGASVGKEISATGFGKHRFCYIRPGPNSEPNVQYTQLAQPLDDGHSTFLFRILFSAAESGNLPKSCLAAQREAGMKSNIERCLDK